MSHVQLHVRPRRVRCSQSTEPPPFHFQAAATTAPETTGAARAVQLPFRAVWLACTAAGRLIDAAFFLVVLTVWCALHLGLWSYAFEMGPAANCFGLPCHQWLSTKVIIGLVVLSLVSYVLARCFRRLGHRATSFMLLVLVTFDLAALLLLGMQSVV